MRILYTLAFLLFCTSIGFGHATFMFIEVRPVSCQSYNYDIVVHLTHGAGSDVAFSGYEIQFGDGTTKQFGLSDFEPVLINTDQFYYKIPFNHAYPGPGKYVISGRLFNRHGDIKNMTNSIQTPFYIENTITLDPIFGCNTPPYLENLPYFRSQTGTKYQFDFSVIDPDNDSISFVLAHAYQDKDIEAINFEIASEYEASGIRKIGRISLDPYTGLHLWKTQSTKGYYSIVLKMTEWKKIDGEYHQVSQSTLDYLIELTEDDNKPPQIQGLADTAIVIGHTYTNNIIMNDPEEDSTQMLVYGDFLKLLDHSPANKLAFSPGPKNFLVNYTPTAKATRSKPYKLLISGTDQLHNRLPTSHTESMLLWITDREHLPDPPKRLLAQTFNNNLISVYWNDTEDELGYILERSDNYFPEFEKLAVLPQDITSYYDSSVVPNNTYRYRVKAVGTQMSAYISTEITTPDIVTSVQNNLLPDIKVYPNPSTGDFSIIHGNKFSSLQIIDITGKDVYYQELAPSSLTSISPPLPSGMYVLNLTNDHQSIQLKLEILP